MYGHLSMYISTTSVGEKREKKPGLIDPPIKYQFSLIKTEDMLCLGVGIASF